MRWMLSIVVFLTAMTLSHADDKLPKADGELRKREAKYYPIETLKIPEALFIEAGSLLVIPDGRLVIGTRRGEVYFVEGAFEDRPAPVYYRFASGLQEILGLAWKDGELYLTQQSEVTRLIDLDKDGRADRFETVSDAWGFGAEHEFTFGSSFDRQGNLWVVCCLSGSYTSDHPFRGWAFRITPEGRSIPSCSGIRSPGGVGMNADGDMFYVESQGPWNGANSLKPLIPGGFMGHPVSLKWYDRAPEMGPRPIEPRGGREGRLIDERKRIPELVPPAVVLPYRKMGQSASAFVVDRSEGAFGPFAGQIFIGDYTLSLVMRIQTEKVRGVYQGACFPFRQGFKTGLIGMALSPEGFLVVGGCSRGWPTRSTEPYALERLRWTGEVPFEIQTVSIRPRGFRLVFTQTVTPETATRQESYELQTYTHRYSGAYGSPEVDHTTPKVTAATLQADGRTVELEIDALVPGHIHEIRPVGVHNEAGEGLLHDVTYYTVNEIPEK